MPNWPRFHYSLLKEQTEKLTALLDTLSDPVSRPHLVELPLAVGGTISVNPAFILSVTVLTEDTTQVIPAGKGPVTISLSYIDVLERLGGIV